MGLQSTGAGRITNLASFNETNPHKMEKGFKKRILETTTLKRIQDNIDNTRIS